MKKRALKTKTESKGKAMVELNLKESSGNMHVKQH